MAERLLPFRAYRRQPHSGEVARSTSLSSSPVRILARDAAIAAGIPVCASAHSATARATQRKAELLASNLLTASTREAKFAQRAEDRATEDLIKTRAAAAAALAPAPIFSMPVDGNWCTALFIATRVCLRRMATQMKSHGDGEKRLWCEDEDRTPEELAAIRAAETKLQLARAKAHTSRAQAQASRAQAEVEAKDNARRREAIAAAEHSAMVARRRCLAAAQRVRDREEETTIKQRALQCTAALALDEDYCQPDDELAAIMSDVQDISLPRGKRGLIAPAPVAAQASTMKCAPLAAIPHAVVNCASPHMVHIGNETKKPPAQEAPCADHLGDLKALIASHIRDFPSAPSSRSKAPGLNTGRSMCSNLSISSSKGNATSRQPGSFTERAGPNTSREQRIELNEIERAFRLAAAEEVLRHIDDIGA